MYAPQKAAAAVPDSLAVKANTVMVSPYHASDKGSDHGRRLFRRGAGNWNICPE